MAYTEAYSRRLSNRSSCGPLSHHQKNGAISASLRAALSRYPIAAIAGYGRVPIPLSNKAILTPVSSLVHYSRSLIRRRDGKQNIRKTRHVQNL